MNVALIGYGKMGMEIEAVAKEKGLTVLKIVTDDDNAKGSALTDISLRDVDVCIDFSTPDAVLDNIHAVAKCGKDIVVGTTGWYEEIADIRQLVEKSGIGFLYASNFSLGVNLFLRIVKNTAMEFDKYADYDVALQEIHHSRKADSPSGTALSLASTIIDNLGRKTEVLAASTHERIKSHQLHVSSTRMGNVTGKHSVLFDSEYDSIELVHTAKNRRGFALGAVVGAQWLHGKKGFFTMHDVLTP